MDSSTKRKVGAIALIVAGIGAFLVPFLLRGPALQASSSNGGNTNSNNNGGTTTTTPASTCTSNCSTDTSPTTCTSDDSTGPSGHTNEGKHLAKGHDKQDKLDTSIVAKAHGFMAALAKHTRCTTQLTPPRPITTQPTATGLTLTATTPMMLAVARTTKITTTRTIKATTTSGPRRHS